MQSLVCLVVVVVRAIELMSALERLLSVTSYLLHNKVKLIIRLKLPSGE